MIKLKKICDLVNGKLKGDADFLVTGVHSLTLASNSEISFITKDIIDLGNTQAGALIVSRDSNITYPNLIFVDEPYLAFIELLNLFYPQQSFCQGIDPQAYISSSVKLGKDVRVGGLVYIGDDCQIKDNTEIHWGVKIYPRVKIGYKCLIYANVVIREDVEIGNEVIIQPGAVIGGDGFGFFRDKNGCLVKIPQRGKVIIGDRCEIGANACIDRSTIEKTKIDKDTKIDNLVQIGHNVKVGSRTVIAALTGVAGSVEIGDNVIIAGQVGIADHLHIGNGAILAAKTGVTGHIKENVTVAGYPHQEIARWRKNMVHLRNLEKYIGKIKALELKIKELEEKP